MIRYKLDKHQMMRRNGYNRVVFRIAAKRELKTRDQEYFEYMESVGMRGNEALSATIPRLDTNRLLARQFQCRI